MYIDAVAVADLEDIEDEAVALSAARSRAAGPYHLMAGQNPVTLFTFQR